MALSSPSVGEAAGAGSRGGELGTRNAELGADGEDADGAAMAGDADAMGGADVGAAEGFIGGNLLVASGAAAIEARAARSRPGTAGVG